ncbi:MAG: type II toxin-antitoxin system HigB family toxin [Bacteroidota bacterium]
MHIIKKQSLKEFWEKHKDSEQQLKAWHSDVEKTKWKDFNDLKKDYSTAKAIGNNRAIFKIKGNSYRLIAKFSFLYQKCYIKFVGTHAEYDKVDAETVDNY